VNYWLPQDFDGAVELEVLDASGQVIRSYRSGGRGMRAVQDQGMRAPFTRMVGTATLSTEPGLNRFVWDMTGSGTGRGGPMVPPGRYTLRLAAGGETLTRDATLVMDPRVAADGVTQADLEEQYQVSLAIAETMAEAREVNQRVQAGMGRASGEAKEAFQALDRRLNTIETGSYQRPMLQSQLSYLYSMLQRADQKPGRDAYVRHEELKTELEAIKAELARLERMIAQ
jgi:hypothetical protein